MGMNLSQKKLAKTVGYVIGIILFSLVVIGVTYAFYRWTSDNINISGESQCFDIVYTKGPVISNESVILFDESKIISDNKITVKSGMALTGFTAGINSGCDTAGSLTVTLNVDNLDSAFISGNSVGAFKYVVASYDPSIYSSISSSNMVDNSFDIIERGNVTSNSIQLLIDKLSNSVKGYLVIFYVDGDMAFNDAGESTFSGTISAVADQIQE